MHTTVDLDKALVLARLNGKDIILPFLEMWRLFWKCHYGWLLPLDWYRWSVEGYSDSRYIFNVMTSKPRAFGLLMHKRGNRSLTKSDYEHLVEDSITDDVFQKLASRFNVLYLGLPTALWPFFYYRQEVIGGITEPAYRAEPGRDRIVVLGPDGKAEVSAEPMHGLGIPAARPPATTVRPSAENTSRIDVIAESIDWSVFQQPPSDTPKPQSEKTRR